MNEDHYLPDLLLPLIRLLMSEWPCTGCSPARNNVPVIKAKVKLLLNIYEIVQYYTKSTHSVCLCVCIYNVYIYIYVLIY